jgi:hypothetical protein
MSTKTDNVSDETTSIEQVDINLEEILGTPGADNVLLPNEGPAEKKPQMFSPSTTDLSFIDEQEEETEEEKKNAEVLSTLKEIDEEISGGDNTPTDDKKPTGRSKIAKDGTVELVKKLIDAGKLIPFDDDKPIEDYSLNDFEELIEANFNERENKVKQEVPLEFFDSLPEELQVAAKYVADGGEDLKGLFRVLSEVEEKRTLDPKNPKDQESIVKEYLRATNFGTEEEIDEEIYAWKDRNELEAKALKFKPKLDKMQEQVVASKLAQQETLRKQQQAAAQTYMTNVYSTLNSGELNGLKLDKKTQGMLYSGLVQPNYPSISGRPTNMLGHLLEKYQYVEQRHDLIAEALWLLADPEGYKAKIKEKGSNETVEKTVRTLKTEQAKMASSTPVIEKEETVQRRIPRNGNIFKR